jgi:hypothetical protein
MNSERTLEYERGGINRERLLELEREGRFVFHGSPDTIEKLEPRQAEDQNAETGEMEKDGTPAVFASPFADVAIFMALMRGDNVPGTRTSRYNMDSENGLHFAATKNLLDNARNITGRVYVLDKQQFTDFKGADCRSEKPIDPIDTIEVTAGDLPPGIDVLEQGE